MIVTTDITKKNTTQMKRFLYTMLLILPLAVSSQNMYNMSVLFDNSPSGSARFLSMVVQWVRSVAIFQ